MKHIFEIENYKLRRHLAMRTYLGKMFILHSIIDNEMTGMVKCNQTHTCRHLQTFNIHGSVHR